MKKEIYLGLSIVSISLLTGCNAYSGAITSTNNEVTSETTTSTSVSNSSTSQTTSKIEGFSKEEIDVEVDAECIDMKSSKIITYFKADSLIPYVSLTDVISMMGTTIYDYPVVEGENGISTFSNTLQINSYNNTISAVDDKSLIKFEEDYGEALTDYYVCEHDYILNPSAKTINVSDYGFEIYEINDENTIKEVVPYFILSYYLFNCDDFSLAYTGKIFYLSYFGNDISLPKRTNFIESYLNSEEIWLIITF